MQLLYLRQIGYYLWPFVVSHLATFPVQNLKISAHRTYIRSTYDNKLTLSLSLSPPFCLCFSFSSNGFWCMIRFCMRCTYWTLFFFQNEKRKLRNIYIIHTMNIYAFIYDSKLSNLVLLIWYSGINIRNCGAWCLRLAARTLTLTHIYNKRKPFGAFFFLFSISHFFLLVFLHDVQFSVELRRNRECSICASRWVRLFLFLRHTKIFQLNVHSLRHNMQTHIFYYKFSVCSLWYRSCSDFVVIFCCCCCCCGSCTNWTFADWRQTNRLG